MVYLLLYLCIYSLADHIDQCVIFILDKKRYLCVEWFNIEVNFKYMHPISLKKRYILKNISAKYAWQTMRCIFYSLTHQILCLVIRGGTPLINKLL